MDSLPVNHLTSLPCQSTRQLVLDRGLSARDLDQLSDAITHLRLCDQCQAAVSDFDQLRLHLITGPTVTDNLTELQWVDNNTSFQKRLRNDFRMPLRIGLAACAAMMIALVSALASYFLTRQSAVPIISVQTPSTFTPISSADVLDRARAFRQVSQAFDNRAGWMLVSNSDCDVGLDAEPSAESGILLLRLTVTRHKAASGFTPVSPEIVSSADLAILPGRNARISLPFSLNRVLLYDIDVGIENPTHIGLSAKLLPQMASSTDALIAKPLAALSTSLDLRPGGSTPAGSFVTGAAGYDITIGFASVDLNEARP